jgi:hypothetical protein
VEMLSLKHLARVLYSVIDQAMEQRRQPRGHHS